MIKQIIFNASFATIITICISGFISVSALCLPPVQLSKRQAISSKNLEFPVRNDSYHRAVANENIIGKKSPDDKPRPKSFGTLEIPTVLGSISAAVIIQRVLVTSSSRLFRRHVIGAAMGSMVFLPAAISSVQSRAVAVQSMKDTPVATRRGVLKKHITTHFYLTYAASLSAVVSVGSIFYNKIVLDKPHFTSLHSRLALVAAVLWAGSYLVAQKKVWTPLIRGKKKGPNLLWASKRHRQLGKAASLATIISAASGLGLTTWGRAAFGLWLPLIVGIILTVPITLVFPRK